MHIKDWNIEALTGYKPLTTFYRDFSIADHFGAEAVRDTYRRGLETAKALGYKELTEFVMVLNWKINEHFESNKPLARVYNQLWFEADTFTAEYLQGEELTYFFRTID